MEKKILMNGLRLRQSYLVKVTEVRRYSVFAILLRY